MPLVVSMHGGRFAFCMCTSPAACGQWECHIHPRTCLCVPCYECFFPSHIPRLDLGVCHLQCATRDESRPTIATANTWPCTEERGPGWRTSISTFHTLRHNMSAWIYLSCFSQLFLSSSSKHRKRHCYSIKCQEKSTWHSDVTKGHGLRRKSVGLRCFFFFFSVNALFLCTWSEGQCNSCSFFFVFTTLLDQNIPLSVSNSDAD